MSSHTVKIIDSNFSKPIHFVLALALFHFPYLLQWWNCWPLPVFQSGINLGGLPVSSPLFSLYTQLWSFDLRIKHTTVIWLIWCSSELTTNPFFWHNFRMSMILYLSLKSIWFGKKTVKLWSFDLKIKLATVHSCVYRNCRGQFLVIAIFLSRCQSMPM